MADLDTRAKRESSIGICLPFTRVLPLPNGSDADTVAERAHLCMNYNGIAAGAPVSEVASNFRIPRRVRRFG